MSEQWGVYDYNDCVVVVEEGEKDDHDIQSMTCECKPKVMSGDMNELYGVQYNKVIISHNKINGTQPSML